MLFGAGQQPPRQRDLDRRIEDEWSPAPENGAKVAASYGNREKHQRADDGSEEDNRRGAEVADGDANQEIRDAPDQAHGCEEQPPPP